MVFGLAWILRGRLTLSGQGIAVRGLFGERMIPWAGIEGYRLVNNQLYVYPAGAWWPMNLSYFENQPLLFARVQGYLPDLDAQELAEEARETRPSRRSRARTSLRNQVSSTLRGMGGRTVNPPPAANTPSAAST